MLKHENMQIIFYQNLYLFVPFCTHALPLGEAKHKPPNCTIQYENVVVPRGYLFAVLFVAISVAILCVSWLFKALEAQGCPHGTAANVHVQPVTLQSAKAHHTAW